MEWLSRKIATVLLLCMFTLLFFSARGDSATMDELAHIPSGYSYLAEHDYRLNPEHPPLIKDLSAAPLLFLGLNFPTNVTAWTTDINGQWDMGRIFLYQSGNNADKIINFARLPIILLTMLFGWLFFRWVSGLYGEKVGLLALFFFVLSPTFLAHSKYVTTDLGAAFGFFIGIATFLNFLFKGNKKSLILAGLAFGIAELLKFSLIILAPLYVVLGFLWVFLKNWEGFNFKKFLKEEILMTGKIILIGLIGLIVIWAVYIPHVWNYPPERQTADTIYTLQSFGIRPLADLAVWMADKPVLRALGQYFLGILMVIQRAAGGNTAYFMGEISSAAWRTYFPYLYFFKEHLAFHILTIMGLIFGLKNIIKSKEKNFSAGVNWLKENFALTASFIFIAVYWTQALTSNLNIGVRHVLPTFPFLYLLVARQTIRWIKNNPLEPASGVLDWFKKTAGKFIKPVIKSIFALLLLLWMAVSAIITYPNYISYFNTLGGGTENGYKIAVDSNYDWGQDLKRLEKFVEKNNIQKIAVDYFGGGSPEYYLGEKFEPWWSSKGRPEGWFAISLTFSQGTYANPTKGYTLKPEDLYAWMRNTKPVARAGTSILIYKF